MKSQNGFATYYDGYGWYPDDFTMNPGQGYLYLSNDDETKVLTYNTSREEQPQADQAHQLMPEVHKYQYTMSVIAMVTLDGEELRDNLEIGAFVNGECRGSAILRYFEPTDHYYALISVSGEDGDNITFSLPAAEGKTTLTFTKDAVVGTLDNPANLIFTESYSLNEGISFYPNPVSKNETLTLNVPVISLPFASSSLTL